MMGCCNTVCAGPFPLNLPHLPVIALCDFIHSSHKGYFQSPEKVHR